MVRTSRRFLAPLGYRAAAVRCGLKTGRDQLDLALVCSDLPATAAGVFTTNRFAAPSVILGRRRLRRKHMRGIVVNAGNANACTGKKGAADAEAMAATAGELLGLSADDFFVNSTGIIGHFLPMDKVRSGIRKSASLLSRSARSGHDVARAIMTTDTRPKERSLSLTLRGSRTVRLSGVAKGSGMISPNMATMLCFLLTDARLSRKALRSALKAAVDKSFNCITVDGDSSTNDTVLLLANGASPGAEIVEAGPDYDAFCGALTDLCTALAKDIVRDGEGATKLIEVNVTGAPTNKDARLAARAVALSPLVKCAVHGGDPNWGRIVCAAGYSGARFHQNDVTLHIGGACVFRSGMPTANMARALRAVRRKEVKIDLKLGAGNGSTTVWTCDLSAEYVAINALYHT